MIITPSPSQRPMSQEQLAGYSSGFASVSSVRLFAPSMQPEPPHFSFFTSCLSTSPAIPPAGDCCCVPAVFSCCCCSLCC